MATDLKKTVQTAAAAAQTAAAQPASAPPLPKPASKRWVDEFSNGKGTALRAQNAKYMPSCFSGPAPQVDLDELGPQAARLGLTPAQVQQLYRDPETSVLFAGRFENFTAFADLATAYGLEGGRALTLLRKMMAAETTSFSPCATVTDELLAIEEGLVDRGLLPGSRAYRAALREEYQRRQPTLADWAEAPGAARD